MSDSPGASLPAAPPTLRIGQAVLPKKVKEVLRPRTKALAAQWAALLGPRLGLDLKGEEADLKLAAVEESPDPSLYLPLSSAPGDRPGFIRLGGSLALLWINRFLGVTGDEAPRPLSVIERRMIEAVSGVLVEPFSQVWSGWSEHLWRSRPATDAVGFREAHAEVFFVTLGVSLVHENARYEMVAGVAVDFAKAFFPAIEKSLEKPEPWSDSKTWPSLQQKMAQVPVLVKACLGEPEVPLSDLTGLQPGHVIRLGPMDQPLTLKVGEVPAFQARPGTWRGHWAVQISALFDGRTSS